MKQSGLADSPLFKQPTSPHKNIAATPLPPEQTVVLEPERANTRTPEQMHTRTGERAFRRTSERVSTRLIVRESYNVYQDQHKALSRMEARSKLSGYKGVSISEMVREALDDYLQKKRKTIENTRTDEHENA